LNDRTNFAKIRREKTLGSPNEKFKSDANHHANTNIHNTAIPLASMSTKNLLNSLDEKIMHGKIDSTTTESSSSAAVAPVAAPTNTTTAMPPGPLVNREENMKRINRGFSARRYLRILTKNWDQSLLDKFILDGKIKAENLYEKNDRSFKRKFVEDDLSMWPQSYRFDPTWTNTNVDMRGYKFLRVQEFGKAKRFYQHAHPPTYLPFVDKKKTMTMYDELLDRDERLNKIVADDMESEEVAQHFAKIDPIKIFDENQNEINYKNLNIDEKQEVLAELLFHSVLNNIKNQRTVLEFNFLMLEI
jgi:hypothetical protein